MNKVELGTVIAERQLQSSLLTETVRVKVGSPQKTVDDDFITPYQIIGVGDEKVRFAAGRDSMQSLQLVFKIIGAEISRHAKEHHLRWADGDDASFPES